MILKVSLSHLNFSLTFSLPWGSRCKLYIWVKFLRHGANSMWKWSKSDIFPSPLKKNILFAANHNHNPSYFLPKFLYYYLHCPKALKIIRSRTSHYVCTKTTHDHWSDLDHFFSRIEKFRVILVKSNTRQVKHLLSFNEKMTSFFVESFFVGYLWFTKDSIQYIQSDYTLIILW